MSATNDGADAFSKSAASATINWILKDGLGQAGGIALVALLGSKLDSHAKSLRFHSSLLLVVGSAFEFAVPWLTSEFGLGAFLPVAAVANVAKNVSWMLMSATRAHFMRQMALKGNLGDLTGKAASQMTLATLIGTTAGLAVLKAGHWPVALGTWSIASIATLFTGFKSCRTAFSRQLNPARLLEIIKSKQRGGSIIGPEDLNAHESFLLPRKLPFLHFNVPLTEVAATEMEWIWPLSDMAKNQFAIARVNGALFLWTTQDATPHDRLRALICALSIGQCVNVTVEELSAAGWDTDRFSFAPFEDANRALRVVKEEEEKED